MARPNVYRLRNLSISRKIAISVALLGGLSLFLSGWIISVAAINWDFSWMTVVDWGTRLGMLGADLRWGLFVAHVSSLLIIKMPISPVATSAPCSSTIFASNQSMTWPLYPGRTRPG